MIYFTVGPSQIHEAAQSLIKQRGIIDILSLSHRSSDFSHLYREVTRKLRALLRIPESHHIFFLSSANEAWERVIQNTVAKKSSHYTTGAFGVRFAQIAAELGRDTYVHTTAPYQPIDFASLGCPPDAEVACFTHNESSTGLVIPLPHLYGFKKRYPHALLALDTVSSFPYAGVDFESIDMAYVSVQKGFGLPAGMCILIVSPRAYERSLSLQKSGHSIGSYHSFPTLQTFATKGQTPETPNVFVFSLLDAVLDGMLTRPLSMWQSDLEKRAHDLYAWLEKKSGFRVVVSDPAWRSVHTLVIEAEGGNQKLIEYLKSQECLVGEGYGSAKNTQIRIGNFITHSDAHWHRLLDALERYTS